MKKLLIVLLALTVIGSFATAQVTLSTWNRIGMKLYEKVGAADANTAGTPSWGRTTLSFAAKADFFGIAGDIQAQPGTGLSLGDNSKIYAKLFNKMVTLTMGQSYFDNLRGKFGGAQSVGVMWGGGEDDIFARFQVKAGGIMVEVAPMDGLYMGVDVIGPGNMNSQLASVTYRDIQIGAGYTIPDVGLARAQYISSGYANQAAQVAFALTGVQGLTVDAGAKFYITKTTAQNFASVGAKYSMDALNLFARTKVLLPNDPAKLDLSLGANVNYKVADGIIVGADVGLNSILDTFSGGRIFAATPYLQHNPAGGGTLQLGVQIKYNLDAASDPLSYAIPLVFTF